MGTPDFRIGGYNRPSHWHYKLEGKQNAKGQLSFTIEIEGPDEFLMSQKFYSLLESMENMAREKKYKLAHDSKQEEVVE